MEAVVQDIEGEEKQLVDGGQLDVCITGFYDLAFIVAAKCGWDLERLLFEGSDEDLRRMCSDLFDEYGAYFKKIDVRMFYGRLVLISKMGIQKYRALSVQKRKELFDLDLESIDRLGGFKVSTLLRETKWVRDIFELREECWTVQTIRFLVDRHVRSITVDEEGRPFEEGLSDSSNGAECGSSIGGVDVYGSGKWLVLHVNSFDLKTHSVVFDFLVKHLKDNRLLDPSATPEDVVFNDDCWSDFNAGLDVLIDKGLVRIHGYEQRFGDSYYFEELVVGLRTKLEKLRKIGFMQYLLLMKTPLPFTLNLSAKELECWKGCMEVVIRKTEELCEACSFSSVVDLISDDPSSDDDSEEGSEDDSYHSF